ncbi:YfaP family protein [Bradyrhizobium sp.]|uniref:YfaP family protein n=1 Tax=Bradyrhizobium sp. TaxID=376 RepID=UPI0040382570
MRRPNRNIEIFSMSVLDLFAAALGGFILIAVILFPNYMKTQKAEVDLKETRSDLQVCKKAESEAKQSLATKTAALATCEAALASTFLVVVVEWSSAGNFDVDLHVTDPEGRKFFWGKSNRDKRDFPATEAQLSYDNTRGPGVELWQHPKAVAGTYTIAYDYYGSPGGNQPVEVRGNVFHRNGRIHLPNVTLTETHKLRPVAKVVVNQSGGVDARFDP